MRSRAIRVLLAAAFTSLVSCGTTRLAQLERVAKDWCETIRASQVIPVYPLTEDLQPGDIFLVRLTVDEQHEAYRGRGFLPLDNHVGRIDPAGFTRFYASSFLLGGEEKPVPKSFFGEEPAWKSAPRAAFPSYTFAATSGGGLSLALPVSGVPVALSLLAADEAVGTVVLSDARTYGVDQRSLYEDLRTWWSAHREFVSHFSSSAGRPTYLRIVTRVYLVKKVSVSLQSTSQIAAGGSAGAPKPVDLLVPRAGQDAGAVAAEGYAAGLRTLNETVGALVREGEELVPGGSAKLVAASARSITLEEEFESPLGIGYLGFDVRILENGELGPPVATYSVLEHGVEPSATSAFFTADEAALLRARRQAQSGDVAYWKRVLAELDPSLAGSLDAIPEPAFSDFWERVIAWTRKDAVDPQRQGKVVRTIESLPTGEGR